MTLPVKLLCLLPDRHMVSMIIKLVQNYNFIFVTTDGIKNQVAISSKYGPTRLNPGYLLFNIYTHDLPVFTCVLSCLSAGSKKFACADDWAHGWKLIGAERGLTQDMVALSNYPRIEN